jgi:exodeoxyribonuclease VII large subunit
VEGVDVIVVARGGGSTADLLAFDDERLCRAIFACAVPVITSIGHTKDRPNCDHVAAAFAPVPAKAAELAIRHSAADLLEDLDRHRMALARVLDRPRLMVERMGDLLQSSRARVTRKRLDLLAALDRRSAEAMRELRRRLASQRQAIDSDAGRLAPTAERVLTRHAERVAALGAVLGAKDFRRRGWVMASDGNGRVIRGVAALSPTDTIDLSFADGEATATITHVKGEEQP